MITIQVLLVVSLILLAFLIMLANPRNLKIQAGKKILGALIVLIAIFFVLFPDKANDIAHAVGVGRGADLLLYLLTLTFFFTTLSFYLRIKEEQNNIVKLARKIAILETNLSEKK